ncbi:hypothetical protein [Arthrobacter sp. FW306-07-I]|uniref:hypothetical protein n=1 Tax=Arthrobacter sp. FW306-07-I TaxID=2879622 RepID=UPI001F391C3E|nr:hypothetical protein [Arthrobacter sp. FW306-07-I]UKA77122.1 hypothetical protein LFT46_08880 [Arthrobacter sp. FW306-07-I]
MDQIKLSISGEEITGTKAATDTYITEDELQVAVDEAHRRHVRVCTHARSRDSVLISLKTGVDMIYHASYIDEEGMDLLEAAKDRVFVAPAINWLVATLNDAEAFGYSHEAAEQAGYARELDIAVKAMQEMRRRGIRVLPGGDYGFAWTPCGTYARDLDHFVKLFGYTEMEAIIAATALGGGLFQKPNELGQDPEAYAQACVAENTPATPETADLANSVVPLPLMSTLPEKDQTVIRRHRWCRLCKLPAQSLSSTSGGNRAALLSLKRRQRPMFRWPRAQSSSRFTEQDGLRQTDIGRVSSVSPLATR